MERNETLYKKIGDKVLYDIFRYGTSVIIILGGVGMVAGLVTGDKKLVDSGYDAALIGTAWKVGVLMSEKRFEPVSGLEKKIGG